PLRLEPSCPVLDEPGPPPSSLHDKLSRTSSSVAPSADQLPPPACPFAWPLRELLQATDHFSERLKVGEGGFGCVYRARLRNTDYAVKRLKEVTLGTGGGWPAGQAGWGGGGVCFSCSRDSNCLPPPSSNILLDVALGPRLADFGLARFGRRSPGGAGMSSMLGRTQTVRGTLAYLPPEYVQTGALSTAIDVFSFGVVLLEILTGRRALETDQKGCVKYLKDLLSEEEEEEEEQRSLSGTTASSTATGACLGTRLYQKHVDPRNGPCPEELGTTLGRLACRCLHRRGKRRPPMTEVLGVELKSMGWEPGLLGSQRGGGEIPPPLKPPLTPATLFPTGDSALRIIINPARLRIMERLALYKDGELDSLAVLDSAPVSYTHLDVYKRQKQGGGLGPEESDESGETGWGLRSCGGESGDLGSASQSGKGPPDL
uniref:Interleukin 1 receptor associated kinase 1 n=1 Tax=Sphenodon punctatus TaxID=8508 RepID=A0A8D0H4U8_SPHPU